MNRQRPQVFVRRTVRFRNLHRQSVVTQRCAVLLTLAGLASCTPSPVQVSASASKMATTPPTSPPATGISCKAGAGIDLFGRHYCTIDRLVTYDDAREDCAAFDARLATMSSPVDEVLLRSAIGSPARVRTMWTALERTSTGWRWGSGAALKQAAWAAGEPNDSGGREDCVEWSTDTGRWNDVPCDSQRAVLCEGFGACSGERVETPLGTYCVYPDAALTQPEGQALCERTGGELARLMTTAENQALSDTIAGMLHAERLWVGLTDRAQEGSWQWEGQTPMTSKWLAGEPNNDGNGEDCGEWHPFTGGFNDMSCESTLPALCER